MTKLMEQAIEAVAKLPDEKQNVLAEMLIEASTETPYQFTKAERLAIDEGLADIKAGRFADDKDVANIFNTFRSA